MSQLSELIDEHCPEGVEYKKLGEVCTILAGGDLPKGELSEERTEEFSVPIYSNGVGDSSLYGYTNKPKITTPCVTISARGTIGYCTLHEEPFFPIVRLLCVIPNQELNVRFLKYCIDISKFNVPKIGIPQLTVPVVSRCEIPVPPLPVQEEIVRILDTFTALITELNAELEARKQQYEYYRNKLLTFDKEKVEYKTMGEIGTFVRGNGLQKNDFTEDGVPCIHYGQIYTYYGTFAEKTKSFVSEESAKKFKKAKKGDIIIACTSENVEDVCKSVAWLGDEDICISGHSCVFSHNQNPKYIAYFLQTSNFFSQKKKYAQGIKVIDIKISDLEKIEIPIPPLAEQQRIVSILDRFEKLTTDLTQGIPAEIEARRQQYEYYRDKLLTFKRKETVEA